MKMRKRICLWGTLLLCACAQAYLRAGQSQANPVPRPMEMLQDDDPAVRAEAVDALLKLGPAAIDPLISELRSQNVKIRREVVAVLALLISALSDDDVRIRDSATRALKTFKDQRTVDALTALAKDPQIRTRRSAIQVLAQIRDPRIVAPLIAASKDQDPGIRQSAIQALGQIEDPRAAAPVIAALDDTDQDVRIAAIRALGKMRNPRAVESLIAALGDRREIVRIEATWALKKLTGEDFGSDRKRWIQWHSSQQRPATIAPKR